MEWPILGHKKQTEYLSKLIENKRVGHAYIFAGPADVGKKTIARHFASLLLSGKLDNNPDYLQIDGAGGIKIESIRELAYKMSLRPYAAAYKVTVIDEAQNMTVEAANALLKLFEEPRPYTVIILITSNPIKLLPTIISRAQKITFGLVEGSAYGRPGLILTDEIKTAIQQFDVLNGSDLVEKLKMAYEVADMETEQIKQTLETWLNLADRKNPAVVRALMDANRLVNQNANSKLLLSNLVLNCS